MMKVSYWFSKTSQSIICSIDFEVKIILIGSRGDSSASSHNTTTFAYAACLFS